jgi:hypothetical protein
MKIKQNNIDKLKKLIEESLFKGDSPITEATLSKATLEKREEILKNLKKNKKELVKRYGKDAEAVMYGRATNLAKKALSEMNKQKLKELVRKSLMNEADLEVMADKIGGEDELSLASNLLDDFESKLKSHDWYYMMSDDNRAYTKGSAEESELKKIAKQLASMGYDKDAANLYNKYNVFKATTFDSFITPPEPFTPMYKRKQMGLDEEAEFSKEYDNNPALKGGQKKLPDALQKSIIKKEKGEVDEDIDLGHEDNEPHMIKGELYQIGKYAMKLYAILEELEETGQEIDFPAWWQSKITTAKNMMSGAKHYLDFELKEPAIDAVVDALTGEEPHEGEPMMEAEIGKDEILSARLYKIKNNVQPAFYQKVRMMINVGDLEKAEEFIKRMEPVSARKNTEFAAMKGELDDLDEGFLDRTTAKIKGAASFVGTGVGNLGRAFMGKETKDPKLAAGMTKLGQKAKTLEKELNDVINDINKLFPDTSLAKAPEELQKSIENYKTLLNTAKTANANIAAGKEVKINQGSSSTTSTPTTSPSSSNTTQNNTSGGGYSVNPRTTKPSAKSSSKPNTYNYKGKDYELKTDADGSYIMVGGTKVAVQPNFDPNKGQTSPTTKPSIKPSTKTSPARDAKGRFVSTKKVAEALAKKLKSK